MKTTSHHGQAVVGLTGFGPDTSNGKQAETGRRQSHDGLEQRVDELEQQVAKLSAKNAELVRVNEELADARRQLQTLLDNIPDRIYFKDTQSRFLKLNQALAKRLGVANPEQAIGKTDFDFQLRERAKEFYADEQRIMETGEALISKTEKQVMPGGETAWTSTTKVPMRDPEGKIIGLVGINRDITQQKRAEEALRQSDEKLRQSAIQLERSNRELQDFAYVASHDLQEPLRKIVVFGERLKEKNADKFGTPSLDYLDRMQKAAGRMQTLINGLLTFSRVTTKAQPFTPVNLAEVASGVVDDLEGRIELVKGRVEVGTLPVIDAEPLQMRQLLQNLVGNALKFRRPEEPPVVKVEAQIIPDPDTPDKKLCRLTVSDNCIGFDEKYVDRIFNVFQRLHTRNEYEGTGMGLAIVKKIALYHGGDVTAKSKPGEGSTFILTVPVVHPKKTQDEIKNKEDQTP
ncbi:MAG: ATP-binding protein [Verrucomicrobiota bacterium]|jgi:PAS domain S-box-containing protein